MSDGQLTLDKIYGLCKALEQKGEDLSQYQVYLGDDDELNGIHTAWYSDLLLSDNEECKPLLDMIAEDRGNVEFRGKGILLS